MSKLPFPKRLPLASLLAPLVLAGVLAGCAKETEITAIGGSIGQEVKRTSCPAVGVPAYAGDVTLFNPPSSRDARAIDIVADITDVKASCDESNPASTTLTSTVSFRVDARRSDSHGARDVVLPYFAVVLHGGTAVASKSISRVSVHFDDGKLTVTIFKKYNKLELWWHFWSIRSGKRVYAPRVITLNASAVEISGPKKLEVHKDGSSLDEWPLKLRLDSRRLTVFCKSGAAPSEPVQ